MFCVSLLSRDRYQYDSLILSKQPWAYPRLHLQQLLRCVVSVRLNLPEVEERKLCLWYTPTERNHKELILDLLHKVESVNFFIVTLYFLCWHKRQIRCQDIYFFISCWSQCLTWITQYYQLRPRRSAYRPSKVGFEAIMATRIKIMVFCYVAPCNLAGGNNSDWGGRIRQTYLLMVKIKVKQSRSRPGVAQRVPGS